MTSKCTLEERTAPPSSNKPTNQMANRCQNDPKGTRNAREDNDLTLAEAISQGSKLVLCDYCNEVFKCPLLLPCLHTFCKRCVVDMVMQSNQPWDIADTDTNPFKEDTNPLNGDENTNPLNGDTNPLNGDTNHRNTTKSINTNSSTSISSSFRLNSISSSSSSSKSNSSSSNTQSQCPSLSADGNGSQQIHAQKTSCQNKDNEDGVLALQCPTCRVTVTLVGTAASEDVSDGDDHEQNETDEKCGGKKYDGDGGDDDYNDYGNNNTDAIAADDDDSSDDGHDNRATFKSKAKSNQKMAGGDGNISTATDEEAGHKGQSKTTVDFKNKNNHTGNKEQRKLETFHRGKSQATNNSIYKYSQSMKKERSDATCINTDKNNNNPNSKNNVIECENQINKNNKSNDSTNVSECQHNKKIAMNEKHLHNNKDTIGHKKHLKHLTKIVEDSLSVNNFLESLAWLYHQRNDTHRQCAYCKSDGVDIEASVLCLPCRDHMCEACAGAHRKTRITREHQLAPFQAIGQGLYDHDIRNVTASIPCPEHPKFEASHFCSDCLVITCKSCRSRSHYNHSLLPMAEASSTFLPEIKRIQNALATSCPSLKIYAQSLNQQITTFKSIKDATIAQIKQHVQTVIQMITERGKIVCKQIEDEFDAEKTDIGHRIYDITTSERSTKKSASFLRHLANLGNAEEQMSMYAHVVTRRKELIASTPKMVKSKLGLTFCPGPNTDTNISILVGKITSKRIPNNAKEKPNVSYKQINN